MAASAPAIAEVVVTAFPADAFRIFTDEIGLWCVHRGFERVPAGEDFVSGYAGGWQEVLGWFGQRANEQEASR